MSLVEIAQDFGVRRPDAAFLVLFLTLEQFREEKLRKRCRATPPKVLTLPDDVRLMKSSRES